MLILFGALHARLGFAIVSTRSGFPDCLALRRREHTVLETLMLRQGKTVSKSVLMESVFSLDDEPSADAIDIYIHRLRKHLARSSAIPRQ